MLLLPSLSFLCSAVFSKTGCLLKLLCGDVCNFIWSDKNHHAFVQTLPHPPKMWKRQSQKTQIILYFKWLNVESLHRQLLNQIWLRYLSISPDLVAKWSKCLWFPNDWDWFLYKFHIFATRDEKLLKQPLLSPPYQSGKNLMGEKVLGESEHSYFQPSAEGMTGLNSWSFPTSAPLVYVNRLVRELACCSCSCVAVRLFLHYSY